MALLHDRSLSPPPQINRGFIKDSVGLPDAVLSPLLRLGYMAATGAICVIHEHQNAQGSRRERPAALLPTSTAVGRSRCPRGMSAHSVKLLL